MPVHLACHSGALPAPYSMSTGALSHGFKQPGREVNHSPPSSIKVKKEKTYMSILSIRIHSACAENLTFNKSKT
jgi:hypothetical protein